MKNIAFLFLMIAGISWGQEKTDTVLDISKASKITIIENTQGLNVVIDNANGNPSAQATYTQKFDNKGITPSHAAKRNIPFTFPGEDVCDCEDHHSQWEGLISGVGLGMTSAINAPSNYDFEFEKSIQITWPMIFGVRYNISKRSNLTAGIGVDWRNLKTTGGVMMLPNEEGGIGLDMNPEDAPLNSRIKIFSLQLPIVFSQRLPFSLGQWKTRVSFGHILNLNTHASLKNSFRKDNGDKMFYYNDKIHQRKFTVDAYLSLHFGELDIYGQFSPMKVLKGHNSPDIQPLTIGVGFGMP